MRLPFFRTIICSSGALVAFALGAGISPDALGQQNQLPGIQQNQPQVSAPLLPTIVDRGMAAERATGSQENWSAIPDGPAVTGIDPERRRDSNVQGLRSFQSSFSADRDELQGFPGQGIPGQGIPVRTSVTGGSGLSERGLSERGFNEQRANEQGAGVTGATPSWLATGQNQSGIPQPSSGLPAAQGFGGQTASPSSGDRWQAAGNPSSLGGQIPQIPNPNIQPGRGTGVPGISGPPLIGLPGGETLAPGNRILQTDRTDRNPAGDNLLARQNLIGGWDARISLPDMAQTLAPLPRAGRRASFVGDDGLEDTLETEKRHHLDERSSYQVGGSGNVAASLVNAQKPLDQPPLVTDGESRGGNSTDQLASLLTVCFFLGNLVLAYFLYDSRMKYQHLADEIQSRFFREP